MLVTRNETNLFCLYLILLSLVAFAYIAQQLGQAFVWIFFGFTKQNIKFWLHLSAHPSFDSISASKDTKRRTPIQASTSDTLSRDTPDHVTLSDLSPTDELNQI